MKLGVYKIWQQLQLNYPPCPSGALTHVELGFQGTNDLDQFNNKNNLLNYKILLNILDPKVIVYSGF